MKVFVSWSGDLSHSIAEILSVWLPKFLPVTDVWVSSHDVQNGRVWAVELSRQLQICDAGILCLTRENARRPWINFEAGAIWKSYDSSLVCPLLIDIGTDALPGCLQQFQAADLTVTGLGSLLRSLNRKAQNPIGEAELGATLQAQWPAMHDAFKSAQKADREKEEEREPRRLLEQIVLDYSMALDYENAVFRRVLSNELFFWATLAAERSHRILDANVENYNQVLVDLYRIARESVFSTSLPEYDTTWDSPLGEQILAAHSNSAATVTRVFVFETREQVLERHLALMEKQSQVTNVNVRVYINQEDKLFDFSTDYSRDFTIIDGGAMVGLTQSYGLGNLRAEWHFGDAVLAGRLRFAKEALTRNSIPFPQFKEQIRTRDA